MDYKNINVEKKENVALITMNRADSMNCLEQGLVEELYAATDDIAGDDNVRCVIITGTGKAFCAGGDIRRFSKGFHMAEAVEYVKSIHPWAMKWINLNKPTIAAVNGHAVGAGLSLSLMCDMSIASDRAVFTSAFIKMGLVPDLAATYFLPRAVGIQRAREIFLTGRQVKSDEAAAMGLVNRVVPHDSLMEEALRLAASLTELPAYALISTKRMANSALDMDLGSLLEMEAQLQGICFMTGDSSEAVKAFLEKRKPRFEGK
jgi:2-(1,2-epoxy-1,2-dihydrophenyl)acetyl-CoA isomerase